MRWREPARMWSTSAPPTILPGPLPRGGPPRGRSSNSKGLSATPKHQASFSLFLLVAVWDWSVLAQRMHQEVVAIRPFPGLEGVGDAVRISVGPWEIMEAALAALAKVLA